MPKQTRKKREVNPEPIFVNDIVPAIAQLSYQLSFHVPTIVNETNIVF